MKLNSLVASIGLATFLTLIVGCAGSQDVLSASGTRGEGNIPVGRVQDPKIQRANLKITDSMGATMVVASDSEGIFWAPLTAYGEVQFEIIPKDPSLQTCTFTAEVGVEQAGIFLADPLPTSTAAVVDSITLEFPSRPVIRVGQTVPVKVSIKGKNVGGLKPLIWLDGGVASLNPGQNMVTTTPGSGVVHATLLGVEARLEFTVLP